MDKRFLRIIVGFLGSVMMIGAVAACSATSDAQQGFDSKLETISRSGIGAAMANLLMARDIVREDFRQGKFDGVSA